MDKAKRFRIGLRTLKTAAAVVIAMAIVNAYGATTSKLIFAMLGAMAAMEPTFNDAWKSCKTQAVGVFFGAAMGVVFMELPIPPFLAAGVGIVIVITLYNAFQIRFSPVLPCLIVVTMCTSPGIQPVVYACGRFWDTAIGLGVGMAINTLVFPYDNSKKIHETAESLDREVLHFLEDMFDGDEHLPDTSKTWKSVENMKQQLNIFSNQRTLLRLKKNRKRAEELMGYEGKARQLVAQLEVLSLMECPGRLYDSTRERLESCGAVILDTRRLNPREQMESLEEADVITNYHIRQVLDLRDELMGILNV